MHKDFLTMISISLFYCCEKVFTHTNIWRIGKNLMTFYYLKKKFFYSHLIMEDVTDADYVHAKRVCKKFKIRNLGDYCYLYVRSYTLLLANVFENFQNMCLKIYELDPAHFLSAPGLT